MTAMGRCGAALGAASLLLAALQVTHAVQHHTTSSYADYLSHLPTDTRDAHAPHQQQHDQHQQDGQLWYNDDYGARHAYWSQHAQHEQPAQAFEHQHVSTSADSGHAGKQPAAAGGKVPILTILAMTCFMSAMAGLGAVPFFFCGKLKQSWAGLANAVACGVMLAASFDLLHEGAPYSPTLTILGMVLGAVFIKNSQEWLSQFEDASFEELSGADARKAMLIVGVMAAHAFGEGSGVGVSFSGNRGWAQGTLVTIAIGLHNIPEGMAVATVMVAKGTPPRKALFWSLFCAFPQAIVAVPAYMFVETFQSLLPLAMGFAAGCMVWIVGAELMPDALESAPHPQVATAATLSAAWLQGLSMAISQLEQPNGHLASPVQADPRTLLGLLACLLPALCVQPLVAGLASSLLPSLPAALGATSSVVLGLGAAGLVGQLLHGGMGAGRVLVWAVMGAGTVVLLWRNVLRPSSASTSLETKRSSESPQARTTRDTSLGGAQEYDAYAQIRPDMAQWAAVSMPPHGPGDTLLPDHAYSAGGPYMRSANRSSNGGVDTAALAHGQQYGSTGGHLNGQYVTGVPPPSTAMLLNGCMEAQPQPHSLPDGSWSMHHRHAKDGHAAHSNGPPRFEADPLDRHGFLHRGMHSWPHAEDADSTSGPILGSPSRALSSQHGKHVRVVLLAGLVLMLHAGCSVGMHVAQAAAAHAAETAWQGHSLGSVFAHWFLPLAIQGLPIGVACVGIGKVVGGVGRWPAVLAALGCLVAGTSAVLACLAGTTLGQPNADLSQYDAGHWTDKLQSMCAGALLACSGLYLWPAATSSKVQRAQGGALLGLSVVGLAQLVLLGLCAGTPYCIRAHLPVASVASD